MNPGIRPSCRRKSPLLAGPHARSQRINLSVSEPCRPNTAQDLESGNLPHGLFVLVHLLILPTGPLSAYNFFFKEEREKILKLLAGDDKDVDNDPEADDYITPEALDKLRKDAKEGSAANKSPKFEELGKLIGQRWKALPPDRLTKYSELASEDTERYKEEMKAYNGRQEAKMRDEALKPQMTAYPPPMKTSPSMMGELSRGGGPPMPPGYDTMGAPAGYPGVPMGYGGGPPGAGGGYPMDSYGYPSGMYGASSPPGYSPYPGAGMSGGGGYPPNMMGMTHDGGPPPPGPYDMSGAGGAAMYPTSGGYMSYG